MDAIVLVGGYAERLWPLTLNKPKSLLKIMEKEILSYVLDKLKDFDKVDKIIISTNEDFEDYFNNFFHQNKATYSDLNISIAVEPRGKNDRKLGPNGGLEFIRSEMGAKDYMIISGDNIFEFNLSDLFNLYEENNTSVIALQEPTFLKAISGYGLVEVDVKDLFNWDDVPDGNVELKENLGTRFGIDWIGDAKISKSPDDMTINISTDENSAKIIMNKKKEEAILKINAGGSHDLKVKTENRKLIIYDEINKILKFEEKPDWPRNKLISTGCYILKKEDFELVSEYLRLVVSKYIKKNEKSEDSLGEFMKWLVEIKKREIMGYRFTDTWFDIGTLDTLLSANEYYLKPNRFGYIVGNKAKIEDPVYIGEDSAVIDSTIGPNVYIGKNCVIRNSIISNALIYDNVKIDKGEIHHSVIDEGSTVEPGKVSGIIAPPHEP
jgi:NDP-sugar pyrophosphorylase family protein